MGGSAAKKLEFQGLVTSDIHESLLVPGQNFIKRIEPKIKGAALGPELLVWAEQNIEILHRHMIEFGGILFQGFNLTPAEFKKFSDLVFPENTVPNLKGSNSYKEPAEEGLVMASNVPKEREILQHSEMSSQRNPPSKIFFYCETPALSGGETPVCSTHVFMKKLDKKIIENFKKKGVQYTRTVPKDYQGGISIGWAKMYESDDKRVVEKSLKEDNIHFEWRGDSLLTSHVERGLITHPKTGEDLWFNSAYNFNRSSGEPGIITPHFIRSLGGILNEEHIEKLRNTPVNLLPINTKYGDGTFIEASVLAEIDRIYLEEQKTFTWNKGDFILLDNYLSSHGRNPYVGDARRILTTVKYF